MAAAAVAQKESLIIPVLVMQSCSMSHVGDPVCELNAEDNCPSHMCHFQEHEPRPGDDPDVAKTEDEKDQVEKD